MENKHGLGEETVFDFKYIPDYHVQTSREELRQSGVRQPGIERRNLKSLLVALAAGGIITYSGTLAVASLLRRIVG